MPSSKFFTLENLRSVILDEREKGKTIVLANGCFDLIHVGHIRYLQGAKKWGDVLVVALNSDDSLKRVKGRQEALVDQHGRITFISALECVDYVTLFDEVRADRVILTLKPDVHCKGSDYTLQTVPEREVVRSYGGKIAIVGGAKVQSTSLLIRRIRKSFA
jgi:D-glycero-beta-D-manno-heptose 1-phosphate adenylyltransferase